MVINSRGNLLGLLTDLNNLIIFKNGRLIVDEKAKQTRLILNFALSPDGSKYAYEKIYNYKSEIPIDSNPDLYTEVYENNKVVYKTRIVSDLLYSDNNKLIICAADEKNHILIDKKRRINSSNFSIKVSPDGENVVYHRRSLTIPFIYTSSNIFFNDKKIGHESGPGGTGGYIFSNDSKKVAYSNSIKKNINVLKVNDKIMSKKYHSIYGICFDIRNEIIAFAGLKYEKYLGEEINTGHRNYEYKRKLCINFSESNETYHQLSGAIYLPLERCFAAIGVRGNKVFLVKFWTKDMKDSI